MPLSVFTIESVALILVIAKDSRTIVRKTGSPFVQFISREISQATSSLTFSTRNSILDTRDSRLDPRDSRLDTRNYRGSRLEGLSTYFWAVLYFANCVFNFSDKLLGIIRKRRRDGLNLPPKNNKLLEQTLGKSNVPVHHQSKRFKVSETVVFFLPTSHPIESRQIDFSNFSTTEKSRKGTGNGCLREVLQIMI